MLERMKIGPKEAWDNWTNGSILTEEQEHMVEVLLAEFDNPDPGPVGVTLTIEQSNGTKFQYRRG